MAEDKPGDVNEPEEPTAEAPAEEQPAEEQPAVEEQPAAEEQPVAEAAEEPEAPAEPVAEAPEVVVEGDAIVTGEELDDEIEATPRVKPEIPGADLEVDIVREDDVRRGESRWSEDGDEELPGEEGEESDDAEPQPIADAAIDLAAGARYTATGKRKTAVARVILKPGTGAYEINGRTLEQHFPRHTLQRNIRQPLETVGYESRMDVVALMHGGGVSAQAGALRHGISRALLEADPNLRSELKRRGFLTRDARVKERKKAGLKKARKRPQFSKR
jgi:small subunit ribosomal protein S9